MVGWIIGVFLSGTIIKILREDYKKKGARQGWG